MNTKESCSQPSVLYLGKREGFVSCEILRGLLSMRVEGYDWEFVCMQESLSVQEV